MGECRLHFVAGLFFKTCFAIVTLWFVTSLYTGENVVCVSRSEKSRNWFHVSVFVNCCYWGGGGRKYSCYIYNILTQNIKFYTVALNMCFIFMFTSSHKLKYREPTERIKCFNHFSINLDTLNIEWVHKTKNVDDQMHFSHFLSNKRPLSI